jgi:hypothetical protein
MKIALGAVVTGLLASVLVLGGRCRPSWSGAAQKTNVKPSSTPRFGTGCSNRSKSWGSSRLTERFLGLAGTVPGSADAQVAGVNFGRRSALASPVENPREVGGDSVRQRLDSARVAGVGSFERPLALRAQ